MPTVYTEVEVDVSLDDFSDDDLLDEIDRRGLGIGSDQSTATELVNEIFHKRRLDKDFSRELDELIYHVLGRIV